MNCDQCGARRFHIVDSRHYKDGVRRRRECIKCGHRFTTHELSVDEMGALEVDGNKWRRMRKYLSRLEAIGGKGE